MDNQVTICKSALTSGTCSLPEGHVGPHRNDKFTWANDIDVKRHYETRGRK